MMLKLVALQRGGPEPQLGFYMAAALPMGSSTGTKTGQTVAASQCFTGGSPKPVCSL